MPDETLPSEVRQFIYRHLASVEELEILLLLVNGGPREWTVDNVYQVILSSRPSVESRMEKFTAAGFLTKSAATSATYTLAPGVEDSVRELARCYRNAPVRVIGAIYEKSRDSVQGFADAFKFKRQP
jgi:hypothetical protein